MGADATFAYRGGIFLASALTGLVLLVSLQPGIVQKALGCRPLRYLGKRSYSLYLWHWPIICLTRPDVDVPISGWPLLVLRLTLIGLAAEATYKLVEQPFRTGRAQAALRSLSGAGRTAAVSSVGLCGATAVVLLAVVNPPPLPAALLVGSTPAARATLLPAGPALTTRTRPGGWRAASHLGRTLTTDPMPTTASASTNDQCDPATTSGLATAPTACHHPRLPPLGRRLPSMRPDHLSARDHWPRLPSAATQAATTVVTATTSPTAAKPRPPLRRHGGVRPALPSTSAPSATTRPDATRLPSATTVPDSPRFPTLTLPSTG